MILVIHTSATQDPVHMETTGKLQLSPSAVRSLKEERKYPSVSEGIGIFVETDKGKHFVIDVKSSDTIKHVKTMIHGKERILPDKQKLIFAGTLLEDDKTLFHYNIQNGSLLNLETLNVVLQKFSHAIDKFIL